MRESYNYSDDEILEGIKNSDITIERAFYRYNYSMVKGLVRQKDSAGSIDVDDLYQDVMIVVFTKIRDNELTELTAKLSTYVYKVALNLLLYRLREAKKLPQESLDGLDVQIDPEDPVNLDELEVVGLELVRELRYPCNEILIDWYINKLNYDQIAMKHRYKNANTAKKKKGDCINEVRKYAKGIMKSHNIT